MQVEMSTERMIFAVRTVPARSGLLCQTLQALPMDATIVVRDEELRGVTWCTCTALAAALSRRPQWICVLPDDFVYCAAFAETLFQLCQRTVQEALVLYSQARPSGMVVDWNSGAGRPVSWRWCPSTVLTSPGRWKRPCVLAWPPAPCEMTMM